MRFLNYNVMLLLPVLGAFSLAGCEKAYWDDVRNFRLFDSQAEEMASASLNNVEMRKDDGIGMASAGYQTNQMPTGYYEAGKQNTGGVEVFDTGMSADPQFGGQQMAGQYHAVGGGMPQYAGGQVSGIDSNVLIYDLDAPGQPVMTEGMFQVANQYHQTSVGQMSSGMSPAVGAGAQIYFNHGSSYLNTQDQAILSNVAEQAKFAPSRVTVAGYASRPTQAGSQSVQGQILNLKESMNRSFAVSKALIQKGVPADKIKTVSWGTAQATGNNTQDQRVDILMGER